MSIMKFLSVADGTPQPTSYFDYTLSFVGSQLVFRCSSVLFLYSSDQDHAEQFRCITLLFIALPLRLKTAPRHTSPLQITSILYSSIASQFHDEHFHCVSMQCNSFAPLHTSVPHFSSVVQILAIHICSFAARYPAVLFLYYSALNHSFAFPCLAPHFLCYAMPCHSLANLFPSKSSMTGVVPLPDTI